MSEFPLPPDAPQGLAELLSGNLWNRLVAEGKVFPIDSPRLAIKYLRLKPRSARVFMLGEMRDGASTPPEGILLKIHDDPDRSRMTYEKEKTRRPLPSPDGWHTFLDTESGVVGLPFPNDPEIPELRRIYEPDRFRRLALDFLSDRPRDQWRLQRSLTRFQLLAYKPGRRAVMRAKLKFRHLTENLKVRVRLHLKVENKMTAHLSASQAESIDAATAGCQRFLTPKFLGCASNRSLFAHEWVQGSPVDIDSKDAAATLTSLGEAMAEFHEIALDLPSHHPPPMIIDEINAIRDDLTRLCPEQAAQIDSATRELVRRVPDLSILPSSLLHGDLHLGQFLMQDSKPVIVDFDRSGRGYGCLDIGSMMEDLRIRGVKDEVAGHFLEGYQSAATTKLDPRYLGIARSLAVLRRAVEPLRALDFNWREKLKVSLEECERIFEGDSR